MDLNKKIGAKYPTKTEINLASISQKEMDLRKSVPVIVLVVVLLGVFCKFGVYDLMAAAKKAEVQVVEAQGQLDMVKAATSKYDKVLKEYNEKVSLNIAVPVIATVEERLNLVEQYLNSVADVQAFYVLDDVITANIAGVTLDQISAIYTKLMADDFVDNVQIYKAATGEKVEGALTNATMTIVLAVEDIQAPASTEGGATQ